MKVDSEALEAWIRFAGDIYGWTIRRPYPVVVSCGDKSITVDLSHGNATEAEFKATLDRIHDAIGNVPKP